MFAAALLMMLTCSKQEPWLIRHFHHFLFPDFGFDWGGDWGSHAAKLKDLHNNITPAPKSFASELQGLLARKAKP